MYNVMTPFSFTCVTWLCFLGGRENRKKGEVHNLGEKNRGSGGTFRYD